MSTLPLKHVGKTWPHVFWEDRNPNEEESHVEFRLRMDSMVMGDVSPSGSSPEGEPVRATSPPPRSDQGKTNEVASPRDEPDRVLYFLRDDEEDDPSCEEEIIGSYCDGWHRCILAKPDDNQPESAWLDDRLWSTNPTQSQVPDKRKGPYVATTGQLGIKNTQPQETTSTENLQLHDKTSHNGDSGSKKDLTYREYEAPLSASTLFSHLDPKKRFGYENLPDADRRLIYIPDISPPFVFALVETATPHQVPALRDALSKHLSLRTSLGINISTKDYVTFEMHFHIPFFASRKCPPKSCYSPDGVYIKPPRDGRDISFLIENKSKKPGQNTLYAHEAHFAFTICGVADRRWVAYAFVDADFDPSKAVHNFEFDYDTIVDDQIAASGAVNANYPLFNPREYFLLIVSTRLRQVVDEWAKLIGKIENGTRKRIKTPPSLKSLDEDAFAVFDWTQKALSALLAFHDQLSMTNSVWKRFSSHGGDIHYFSDASNLSEKSQKHMQGLLYKIEEKFQELEDLQQRLSILVRCCQRNANILERHLMLESTKIAKVGYSIAELMIVWVSPAALVCAFFAIPEPFGNFPRTTVSFAGGIIGVFAFLQLLVYVKGGRLQLGKLWGKAKGLRKVYHSNIPRQAEHLQRMRENPRRIGTDDTLVDGCMTA